MNNTNEHKFYKQALQAHYWNSLSPDKRAQSDCELYDELKTKIVNGEHDDKPAMLEKLESKFSAWLSAKGRTASPMVTGPARFPVERNRKALESEMKRYEELTHFVNMAQKGPKIVESTDSKLTEFERSLQTAEENQAIMVGINKMIRQKKSAEEIAAVYPKIKLETAQKLLEKDCMGYVGFAPFMMTNNNAKIKRLQGQIKSLKSTLQNTEEQSEIIFDGVKVLKNKDEDRIQLYFDGKPTPEIIAKLKSLALKWSPSRGCWQRQLTANAINAVIPFLKSNFKQTELSNN